MVEVVVSQDPEETNEKQAVMPVMIKSGHYIVTVDNSDLHLVGFTVMSKFQVQQGGGRY